MTKLEDISKNLIFKEKEHQYFIGEKELTSVTTLLNFYKEPFDPTGIIAYKCGQKEGISKEEMQARWKKTATDACEYGTNFHSQIELYLKTGEIKDTPEKEIVESFSKIKIKGEIFSELRLKSDSYFLAGTADIVNLYKDTVKIHDIKSNREFTTKSKYNKKLLYPLNHLSDSHINIYSLQILIYGEMIKEHGFNFEPGQILWVNRAQNKIEQYDVLDLQKETIQLLEHFNLIRNI